MFFFLFSDAGDLIGAGRYGALRPTLLSHRILSLLCLRLPPTVRASTCVYSTCLHVCSLRPCVRARVSTVLRSSAIAGSDSPAMRNAPRRGSTSKPLHAHTHMHILGDAHRLGQYGCAHEKKKKKKYLTRTEMSCASLPVNFSKHCALA